MKPHEVHAAAIGRGNHDLYADRAGVDIRTSQRYGADPTISDYTGEAQGRRSPLHHFIEYLEHVDFARREAKREIAEDEETPRKKPGEGVRVIIEFLRDYAAAHFDMDQEPLTREQRRAALQTARAALSQVLQGEI